MKMGQNPERSIEDRMEQLGDLAGFTVGYLARFLSDEQIQHWLTHKKEYAKNLCKTFSIVDEYESFRREGEELYQRYFNWQVDFSHVLIPPKPDQRLWRPLFIARGMTANKAFAGLTKLGKKFEFGTWLFADDLDKAVPVNKRTATEHYAVLVIDAQEPDEEFLGKSTRDVDPNMEIGTTLPERLIFHIDYFARTRKHLDAKGLTYCSDSRTANVDVPSVSWDPGYRKVCVSCYSVGLAFSRCGVRRVVSL